MVRSSGSSQEGVDPMALATELPVPITDLADLLDWKPTKLVYWFRKRGWPGCNTDESVPAIMAEVCVDIIDGNPLHAT